MFEASNVQSNKHFVIWKSTIKQLNLISSSISLQYNAKYNISFPYSVTNSLAWFYEPNVASKVDDKKFSSSNSKVKILLTLIIRRNVNILN